MPHVHIRHWMTGKIIHSVSVDSPRPLFPVNLAGCDLTNADLRGADLCAANLEGANLRGAKLAGADLQRANMRGCDIRYSDLSGADLREADLTGAEVYPANVNKKTNLSGIRTGPNSELSTLSASITTAKLRRSGEPDEFDLHQAQKATESLLDFKAKRLEKKVARERRGWKQIPGDQIIKAKLRVLRYSKNIALDSERRRRDLRFLTKHGVDLSFIGKLTSENDIG